MVGKLVVQCEYRFDLIFSIEYFDRDLTLASTETNWTLNLLANHPDVQSHLQREIDAVIAPDHLPSMEDKVMLTYTEAVVLETLRLRTALPISLSRLITADTETDGYHLLVNTEVQLFNICFYILYM